MKKINYILAILLMVIILGACSDDDEVGINPPIDDGIFSFPLAEGNMWEYDVYTIDENEIKTDEKLSTDKTIIGKATTVDGRSGFMLTQESTANNEDEPEVTSVSTDKDGLYFYFLNFTTDTNNVLVNFKPGWLKIVDFEEQNWEALNLSLDLDFKGATYKGTVQIQGSREGMVKLTYDGTEYDALRTKSTVIFDVVVTTNTDTTEVKKEEYSYYTLIDDIGLIETKDVSTNDTTGVKEGTIDVLINHELK